MRTVLVTGASGLIGRHVLGPLVERGYHVHAAHTGRSDPALVANVTWHAIDLLDNTAVTRLLDAVRPSYLLHCAWIAKHGEFWWTPENLDWVAASLHLFRTFAANGGKRFVGLGTCAEYTWNNDQCDELLTARRPVTLYGVSKNALHDILESSARHNSTSFAWGRLFLVFGPGEQPARLVPHLISNALAGKPAVCRFGQLQRDFLYTEDVGDALAALLDGNLEGAVNVASGELTTLRDLAEKIAVLCGAPSAIEVREDKPAAGEPLILGAETTRLMNELGWAPSRTLDERLEHTVEWWRQTFTRSQHLPRRGS